MKKLSFPLLPVLLISGVCLISGNLYSSDCEFEKRIDQELDLSGSEQLSVLAVAGDLEIVGVKSTDKAGIRGRVCVSEEEWLEESGVETSKGRQAEIRVVLPDSDGGWSWTGQEYAYLDLKVEVPNGLDLVVKDSSGDVEIEGAGAVEIKDSSGDMEIKDSEGPVSIRDSSGHIEVADIEGDVTVESDSSGDIEGRDIDGSVLVRHDSSGDIRFSDVSGNVIVEHDSSGDITAKRVQGDFEVLRDGSGDVNAIGVSGEVRVPDDRS